MSRHGRLGILSKVGPALTFRYTRLYFGRSRHEQAEISNLLRHSFPGRVTFLMLSGTSWMKFGGLQLLLFKNDLRTSAD